jgi:hypothetical protein
LPRTPDFRGNRQGATGRGGLIRVKDALKVAAKSSCGSEFSRARNGDRHVDRRHPRFCAAVSRKRRTYDAAVVKVPEA